MRYVQDVANVSQNVRDMQRALLDLALLTEAPPELGAPLVVQPKFEGGICTSKRSPPPRKTGPTVSHVQGVEFEPVKTTWFPKRK